MTVRLDREVVKLEGVCSVDDAEPLLRLLQESPAAFVDWQACEHAHTAIIQILRAAHRPVTGPPRSHELQRWVEPLLAEMLG